MRSRKLACVQLREINERIRLARESYGTEG